ncbi:MAG: hypothetical protein KatS3mg053_1445 [Candidatus Roseilinea sp.]|nr:MAG: hypothetical protein KatS3mg053_1445 [Candidatus Roseilinea sp.]
MQYADFRRAELPIGSGVVESAAKQFKQRVGGAGVSWLAEGWHNLLPLRAAVMSGTFDTFGVRSVPHKKCTRFVPNN